MAFVSLNNQIIEESGALVSINERGFRFGDGVFETILVRNRRCYLVSYHLERLQQGLSALRIASDEKAIASSIEQVIQANAIENGLLRLYVSRGIGSQGYLPTLPAPAPLVLLQPLPSPSNIPQNVALWQSTWVKPTPAMLPTHAKLAQGVGPTLARMEARENACYDALQLGAGEMVCEASSANIFWIKNGELFTPSLETGALCGTTRRRIMASGLIPVHEGKFPLAQLASADEVFITNASLGIIPVNSLLPSGLAWATGSLTQRLTAWREQDIAAETL